jgi:hypothetical protein
MTLNVHSNASYLSKPKAQNHAGGDFLLSDGTNNAPNNGAILKTSQMIKSVMLSFLGAFYLNVHEAVLC